jgi:hypothetical protein
MRYAPLPSGCVFPGKVLRAKRLTFHNNTMLSLSGTPSMAFVLYFCTTGVLQGAYFLGKVLWA